MCIKHRSCKNTLSKLQVPDQSEEIDLLRYAISEEDMVQEDISHLKFITMTILLSLIFEHFLF